MPPRTKARKAARRCIRMNCKLSILVSCLFYYLQVSHHFPHSNQTSKLLFLKLLKEGESEESGESKREVENLEVRDSLQTGFPAL